MLASTANNDNFGRLRSSVGWSIEFCKIAGSMPVLGIDANYLTGVLHVVED